MGRGGEDGMCRKASPGGQGQGSPQSRALGDSEPRVDSLGGLDRGLILVFLFFKNKVDPSSN